MGEEGERGADCCCLSSGWVLSATPRRLSSDPADPVLSMLSIDLDLGRGLVGDFFLLR